MSVYRDRMYDRHKRAELGLRDAYGCVRSFHSCSEQLNVRLRAISKKGLTAYYLGKLTGRMESEHDVLYRYFLVWVLIGADGRVFQPGNDSWTVENTLYKNSMFGFHAWKDSLAKGELKVFF